MYSWTKLPKIAPFPLCNMESFVWLLSCYTFALIRRPKWAIELYKCVKIYNWPELKSCMRRTTIGTDHSIDRFDMMIIIGILQQSIYPFE